MQELGLKLGRQLADLVQVDRAVVGVLESAELPLRGAGERPLLVAEELGLEQPGRNRRAVDPDERTVTPHRAGVDGASHEVLSDPTFAA